MAVAHLTGAWSSIHVRFFELGHWLKGEIVALKKPFELWVVLVAAEVQRRCEKVL
jgi:hypothetical protein